MDKNNKVVYLHINPETDEVFYVGIGHKYRPYAFKERSEFWKNYVNKNGCIIKVIHKNLTLEKAIKKEIFYIKLFGRRDLNQGTLVNLTNGGEGAFGAIRKPRSDEYRKKLSESNKGKKRSKETKRKQTESALKRKPMSEETKEKMSKSHKGKPKPPRSEEHKRKLSESMKGRKAWNKGLKQIKQIT